VRGTRKQRAVHLGHAKDVIAIAKGLRASYTLRGRYMIEPGSVWDAWALKAIYDI
jgi:hypothetical protein